MPRKERRSQRVEPTSRPPIKFVLQDSSPSSTTRQKELKTQELRSHAAWVSHQKRRKNKFDQLGAAAKAASLTPAIRQDSEASTDKENVQAVRRVIYSINRMTGGNSDAFNCASTPITPKINAIIAFVRDVFVPRLYITSWAQRFSRITPADINPSLIASGRVMGARYAYNDSIINEQPEILPVWFSSYMLALASYIPYQLQLEMRRLFLEHSGPGIRRVREHIANTNSTTLQSHDISFISIFFRVACIENEIQAAQAHMQALKLSKMYEVANPRFALQIHLRLIFNDSQFALAAMRRTQIGPHDDIHTMVYQFWQYAEQRLPPSPGWEENVHPCVHHCHGPLKTAILRVRRTLLVAENEDFELKIETEEDKQYADLVYGWYSTTSAYDLGAILNYYLDLVEDPYVAAVVAVRWCGGEHISEGTRWIEAGMALTTMYMIRKGVHESDLDGVDLRDLSHVVFSRLHAALRKAVHVCTTAEREDKYADALLWMFFWAAHHEERVRLGMVKLQEVSEGWWAEEQLMELVCKRKMRDWSQVRVRLERFVHMGFLKPEPAEWYRGVVARWNPKKGFQARVSNR